MSTPIDLSGLTINPREAEDVSQAIFEKVQEKPVLSNVHLMMTGINMKQQIPFFGLMGLVGQADSSCEAPASTEAVAATQKYWEPLRIGFRLTHCQADIDTKFKLWQKSLNASKELEDVNPSLVDFLSQRAIDATYESILRLSAFGDTAADTVDNGGNLVNGTTKAFFTVIDGLWKQVETAVTAGDTVKISIAENAEATYALQDDLADSLAYDTFKKMYNGADSRLLAEQGLQYQVTRSLANNYIDYMESKGLAAGFIEVAEDGTPKLNYRGIPIVIREDWDRNLRAYFKNGTKYYNPHRAILTVPANIPIGTTDEGSMTEANMFYEPKDRQHYMDIAYRMDVKLLEEHMAVVAY